MNGHVTMGEGNAFAVVCKPLTPGPPKPARAKSNFLSVIRMNL